MKHTRYKVYQPQLYYLLYYFTWIRWSVSSERAHVVQLFQKQIEITHAKSWLSGFFVVRWKMAALTNATSWLQSILVHVHLRLL